MEDSLLGYEPTVFSGCWHLNKVPMKILSCCCLWGLAVTHSPSAGSPGFPRGSVGSRTLFANLFLDLVDERCSCLHRNFLPVLL